MNVEANDKRTSKIEGNHSRMPFFPAAAHRHDIVHGF